MKCNSNRKKKQQEKYGFEYKKHRSRAMYVRKRYRKRN